MSTQPLSSFNVFHEIQQNLCDVINQSPILISANIEAIAENRLDIDYQIKENLKKQGMAVVVMTPDAQYLGHNGTSEAYQLDDLTIQIVEYTPINRAKNKETIITGLDLANYISELLGGPNSVIGFGKLCPKGIEQGEDSGLLVTKLTFRTYIENGDTGPIIYVPFVSREEMIDYVGDGKLTFTKNGETIGSFSANTSSDVEIEIPNGGVWGSIEGYIEDLSDLMERLGEMGNEIADNTRDIEETNTKVTNLSSNLSSTISDVSSIKEKIPTNASSLNLLATQGFVNSSINAFAAFYLTKDASGHAFGTYALLSSATQFFNGGEERIPTKNDYLIVLEDETKTTTLGVDPTTRYTYQGVYPTGLWDYQYTVNNTALTQALVDAINSGVTKDIIDHRVIPSNAHPGYAIWSESSMLAEQATTADWADSAGYVDYAGYADLADTAGYADSAGYADGAGWAANANQANSATDASFAAEATHAETTTYAPDYTPLSTFNETLGNLSSIIHGI